MSDHSTRLASPRPKVEPHSAPGSPHLDVTLPLEHDHNTPLHTPSRKVPTPTPPTHEVPTPTSSAHGVQTPTPPAHGVPRPTPPAHGIQTPTSPAHGVPTPTSSSHGVPTPTLPAREVPTPTPLDLSQREAERGASKRREVSGVTLFPGLTITPGRGDDDPDNDEDDDVPPTPSPSPPENSFPRFHFGRAVPGRGSECRKLPARDGSPPPAPALGRPREGDGVGVESWWYPGVVGGDIFRGLPDLPLPFPGLPAFRKCHVSQPPARNTDPCPCCYLYSV